MALPRVSGSLTQTVTLPHVNVPTREQAKVAVAQVHDALHTIYISSPSLRARATSSNHVNDRPLVAYRLLTEIPEKAQEVITEVVSDPNVFAAIWGKLQGIPIFRNLVQAVEKIKEGATSCLIPSDREVLVMKDEISSCAGHTCLMGRIVGKIVEGLSWVWDKIVDLFASAIPIIQAAFAGEGGVACDSPALETAIVITGLVVLVTAVIIVGAVVVL